MKIVENILLNLLGVGELIDNLKTVVEDTLGRHRPRSPRSLLEGKVSARDGGRAAAVAVATWSTLLHMNPSRFCPCRQPSSPAATRAWDTPRQRRLCGRAPTWCWPAVPGSAAPPPLPSWRR